MFDMALQKNRRHKSATPLMPLTALTGRLIITFSIVSHALIPLSLYEGSEKGKQASPRYCPILEPFCVSCHFLQNVIQILLHENFQTKCSDRKRSKNKSDSPCSGPPPTRFVCARQTSRKCKDKRKCRELSNSMTAR